MGQPHGWELGGRGKLARHVDGSPWSRTTSAGAGQRTIGGAVQNNGTLVVTASDGVLTGGLLNQSGGTLSGGVLDVSGSLSYAGANIVTNDATLIVDGAGALIENLLGQDALRNLTTNTGMLTITNGATVSPIGGITNTATVLIGPGATLAPGGLYVQTAGLTTVDGGTLAATVDIQGGTFDGAGTVLGGLRNAGVVAPGGSAGTLIVTGAYLQLAGSALELEIGGASPGTGHDLLQIGGTANLSGTLHIDTIGAFTPTPGQRFTVLRATGGRTGNWGRSRNPRPVGSPTRRSCSLTACFWRLRRSATARSQRSSERQAPTQP